MSHTLAWLCKIEVLEGLMGPENGRLTHSVETHTDESLRAAGEARGVWHCLSVSARWCFSRRKGVEGGRVLGSRSRVVVACGSDCGVVGVVDCWDREAVEVGEEGGLGQYTVCPSLCGPKATSLITSIPSPPAQGVLPGERIERQPLEVRQTTELCINESRTGVRDPTRSSLCHSSPSSGVAEHKGDDTVFCRCSCSFSSCAL